ncbi:MAG: DUF1684 domain-containing protein [Chitinophagales bacterium]
MKNIIYIFIGLALFGCRDNSKEFPENYLDDLEAWKGERDVKLRAEDGYVNLVGLYWLQEGENTIGSDTSNNVVFPAGASSRIGSVFLKDHEVVFECADDVEVVVDSFCLNGGVIYSEKDSVQTILTHGHYDWHIIERAGNYGIRLRDLNHPKTQEPLNMAYFHVSKDWIITAKYELFETPKTIKIDNIVGFNFDENIEGKLTFELDGQSYTLLPSVDDEGMFIMFADGTSGETTYGSGRYLMASLPDEEGNVILDFNKAYNPPCAFTEYATCPLPPRENILEVNIEAGEKRFGE